MSLSSPANPLQQVPQILSLSGVLHCKFSLLLGAFILSGLLSPTFLYSAQARIFQFSSVFIYCVWRTEGPTGFISAACVCLFLILLVAEVGKEEKITFLYHLKLKVSLRLLSC